MSGPTFHVNKDLLYGPTVIGILLALPLLGIVLSQTSYYLAHYARSDRPVYSISVGLIVITTLLKASSDAATSYNYAVKADEVIAKYAGQNAPAPPTVMTSMSAGLLGIMFAQLLFVFRLHKLSERKWYLVAPPALVSIGGTIFALTTLYRGEDLSMLNGAPVHGITAINSWLEIYWWCSAAIDIWIAVVMTVLLRRQQHGFSARTDSMLLKVMQMTLGNAALTVVLQVACVISIRATINLISTIPVAFEEVILPVYAICALYSLNARKAIREAGGQASAISHPRAVVTTAATIGSPVPSSFAKLSTSPPLPTGSPRPFDFDIDEKSRAAHELDLFARV